MTSTLSPSCPLASGAQTEPECSKRLILRESLDRWRREARHDVFDTGRYRCQYAVWGGRGPTLVLIPGMAMDAVGYVMLMARLQSQFRCVSYSFPNGVNDGARLRTYSHNDLSADLFALLDHLSIGRCFLFGSSFGSTVAIRSLHKQPGRFSRAILQGAFARRPLSRAEVLAASFGRYLPGRLGSLPFARQALKVVAGKLIEARELEVGRLFINQHLDTPIRALAVRALLIHQLDLRTLLPAISQPVLVVCGDGDPLIHRASALELAQGLPRVAHAEIEQCGHFPQFTHPEVLAEVVQQFLLAG